MRVMKRFHLMQNSTEKESALSWWMKQGLSCRLALALFVALTAFGFSSNAQPASVTRPLKWDATEKVVQAALGDESTKFVFTVTNQSDHAVIIEQVKTSCGCTVAELPSQPWILEPGESGDLKATMDLKGKRGRVSKLITVKTSEGLESLKVESIIPDPVKMERSPEERAANLIASLKNRQAIFEGSCVDCHVTPASGKYGSALYQTACAICHEAENRASIVPDFTQLNKPTELADAKYWTEWITHSKDNSLMPAFGKEAGGPLDERQIRTLVSYLKYRFGPRTDPKPVRLSPQSSSRVVTPQSLLPTTNAPPFPKRTPPAPAQPK
jgi:cytochrome c5